MMKAIKPLSAALLFLAASLPAFGQTGVQVPVVTPTPADPKAGMQCKQGPAKKTFGGTEWLIYSCDDNRSVTIASAPGNPASPFYFMFAYTDSGYRLSGEGTGNTTASNNALDELKTLSSSDIADLIAQTRQPQNMK